MERTPGTLQAWVTRRVSARTSAPRNTHHRCVSSPLLPRVCTQRRMAPGPLMASLGRLSRRPCHSAPWLVFSSRPATLGVALLMLPASAAMSVSWTLSPPW